MACQCVKCGGKFEKGGKKLKPIPVPRMPMRQIGIDYITNLPKTDEGYDTIVTAIDYTSKWPESKPLKGVSVSQDSAIGSQESVPENPSPIPSDATTVLYPNPEEGDTLLSHTLINDPGHTLLTMMTHIPIHTPSCVDDDDAFLPG